MGLENVQFRTLDAERMDLETNSVDGVLCQVVGAVGVSGGTPDEDHEVAEAGVAAFD